MRTWVAAKLHGLRVTDKAVHYHGSVTIGADLLAAAGIQDFEQVHVVNLANGNRWVTYALPGPEGAFTLNGGGARLGEVGDPCVVFTFQTGDTREPAPVVFTDETNRIVERVVYGPGPHEPQA
jgi:aspartate 1-decarboxylase